MNSYENNEKIFFKLGNQKKPDHFLVKIYNCWGHIIKLVVFLLKRADIDIEIFYYIPEKQNKFSNFANLEHSH